MPGRARRYSPLALSREKCSRCGKPAALQWVSSIDGLHYPACATCDELLARKILEFMRADDVGRKMAAYLERRGINPPHPA